MQFLLLLCYEYRHDEGVAGSGTDVVDVVRPGDCLAETAAHALPCLDLTEDLAETSPSQFRVSPSQFGEMVETPKIESLTGES